MVEPTSAKLTAMAKGEKNDPTNPWMKAKGMNTATVVNVEDMMAAPTSLVPSTAASSRSSPAWMCRYMFSNTTMLSSTTRPTAIASPARVMKFRVKSARLIRMTPDKILKGMDRPMIKVGRRVSAIPFMMVGRRLIRKANTIATANTRPKNPSWTRELSWV